MIYITDITDITSVKNIKKIKSIKNMLFSLAVLAFILYIIKYPEESADIVLRGLQLCYLVIIPVIFPFLAFSKLLMQSSFFKFLGRLLHKPAEFLFGVSGMYANALLIGGIIGFPMGAKTVRDTYINSKYSSLSDFTANTANTGNKEKNHNNHNNHKNHKNQAERTLAFCNNCSISFVVSAVGIAVFNSAAIGFLLFFIQITAAFITGVIVRFIFLDKKENKEDKENTANIKSVKSQQSPRNENAASLTETISEAVNGILNICGIVLFFFILIHITVEYLKMTGLFNSAGLDYAKTIVSGIFEVSSGVYSLVNFDADIIYKLLLSSVILGWSGISVHFQIIYILKDTDLSLKPYFTGKIIHVIICIAATILTFTTFRK